MSTTKRSSTRIQAVIGSDFKLVRFAELPQAYQLSIAWFMSVDGDAWNSYIPEVLNWSETEQEARESFKAELPLFIRDHGDEIFGMVEIPAERLKTSIMADPEICEDHKAWAEYHAWYLDCCDTPHHGADNRWPVIMSCDDCETVRDGWHRLHGYLRDGHQTIPAAFFPESFGLV